MLAAGDTGALVGHRYALRELLTWIALALFLAGVAVRMWPGAGGRPGAGGGGPGGVGLGRLWLAPAGRQSICPPRSTVPSRASAKTSSSASALVSAAT